VDVFFVISGYLITQKTETEIGQGRFTFRGFYYGRARRLLPALFTVLALTFIFGALLLAPEHLKLLGQSTIWAAIPFSNVYFWHQTGYWDVSAALKPLLHTWSLSVEEQFYFVWQLALWALARFRGWPAPAVLALAGIASFIAAASFAADVNSTFYLTPFRVFEFAFGALIVWLDRSSISDELYDPLAYLGLFLVLASVVGFSSDAPTALVVMPCLGAALMIYAGRRAGVSPLWANPIAAYIGRISYSIYLVHWPLIVLYSYWRFEPISDEERYGIVAASLLLAVPLHHLIEQPLRYARPERRLHLPWAIATASMLLIALGASAWAGQGWPWRLKADKQILAEYGKPLCVSGYGFCNSGHPEAVLVGDSHAGAFARAVANSLVRAHINGRMYPVGEACPLVIGLYQWHPNKWPCLDRQRDWLAQIEKDNPRIVILAGFYENGFSKEFGSPYTDGGKSSVGIPEAKTQPFSLTTATRCSNYILTA
jgi:peptidoglycan/LPS O-acetylase OafA/YrhL